LELAVRHTVLVAAALIAIAASTACRRPADAPDQQLKFLVWTTPGPFVQELVSHFNLTLRGVHVEAQHTAGSVFVVSALEKGDGDVGLAQADVVYTAYRRGIGGDAHAHTKLRGIAVLWVNTVFIVVPGHSNLRTVADLRGKRVGLGVRGSSAELFGRTVLEGYDLTYADIKPEFLRVDEIEERVHSATLDAGILVIPTLPDSLRQRNASAHVRLLPVEQNVTRELRARYRFIKPAVITAQTVAHQLEDVHTVGVDGLFVCREGLSEDVVYQLTKQLFAVLPRLARSDSIASLIDPGKAPATPLPLHAGAARYYREREILE
jgi:TRAP transporter TAXI family solute receptor